MIKRVISRVIIAIMGIIIEHKEYSHKQAILLQFMRILKEFNNLVGRLHKDHNPAQQQG